MAEHRMYPPDFPSIVRPTRPIPFPVPESQQTSNKLNTVFLPTILATEPVAMSVIQPTVGRIVWYWPSTSNGGQPLAAIITHVYNERRINVAVFHPLGTLMSTPPLEVHLVQDDKLEQPERPYCTWMPYQLGQANKPKGMTCSMALPTGEIAHFDEGRLVSITVASSDTPTLTIVNDAPIKLQPVEKPQEPAPEGIPQVEPAAWIVEDYSKEYSYRVFATELEARDYNTDQQNNGREDQALHAIRALYEVDLNALNAKLFAAKIQLGAIKHITDQMHELLTALLK